MNFNDMDLFQIPDIALWKIIPVSIGLRKMEKEAENKRYEELESLLWQIRKQQKRK